MSTLDPLPNATGTETQPAPMVRMWRAMKDAPRDGTVVLAHYFEQGPEGPYDAYALIEWDALENEGWFFADTLDAPEVRFEAWMPLVSPYDPAPATLADETLRAENERLRAERDAIRDSLIETQAAQRGLDIRVQETADEFIRLKRDRDRAESEAEEYRGQAEKLTKALDEMTAIKDIHAEKRHEQFDQSREDALATAPAVPDGRTAEVEELTASPEGVFQCPFCGAKAFCEETHEDAKAFRWRAECWECPAEMRAPTREAVTSAWNTRADLSERRT